MAIIISFSLLALIISKIADIVATVGGIQRSGSVKWEQNPLARWSMRKFGFGGGIAFIMVTWCLVVAACYLPAWSAPEWYTWATTMGGFAIAWAQWDVARYGAMHRHSWFARWMLNRYQRLTHRFSNENHR